jgi:hypothetical protein
MFALVCVWLACAAASSASQNTSLLIPSLAGRDLFAFYCASCHGDGLNCLWQPSHASTNCPLAVQLTAHANAYVERVIGSIRRECLDHVIVLNATGLHRMLTDYVAYYNDVSYCPTSLCA